MNKKLLYLSMLLIFLSLASAELYNTTNITNANNIYEQSKALNSIVDGMVGYGILLIVTIITFAIVVNNSQPPDVMAGLGAAGFIGALSATMLLPMGFIGFQDYQKIVLTFGLIIMISVYVKSRN